MLFEYGLATFEYFEVEDVFGSHFGGTVRNEGTVLDGGLPDDALGVE